MPNFHSKSNTVYNQSLAGTTQADNYIFTLNNWGTYNIANSSGDNSLDLSALSSSLTIDFNSSGNKVKDGLGNFINWTNTKTILNLMTGSGNDNIKGNTLNNNIHSGNGNDTIFANAGNDSLDGGLGNDNYIFNNNWGQDNISDSNGIDTIDLSDSNKALIINLNSSTTLNEIVDSNGNTINWTGNIIENIISGSGNDIINSNSINNILNGGSGNDIYIFNNNWGIDSIIDGSGNDTIDASNITSNLIINNNSIKSGANTIKWNTGIIENINSGSGNDNISTNTVDNIINAGAGNDTINAGSGNDIMNAGAGNDIIDGGSGNDIYTFSNNWGIDSIIDRDGNDIIDLKSITTNLNINLSASDGLISSDLNNIQWNNIFIENINSGSGNDTFSGFNGIFKNYIISDIAGNDSLNLNQYNQGSDAVLVKQGNDLLININSNNGLGNILISNYYNSDSIDSIIFGNNTVSKNQAPILSGDLTATINQAGRYFLISSDLGVIDPDSRNFTYNISNIDNGINIQKWNGNSWDNINSFTNTDLNNNLIAIKHNSGNTIENFNISVNDGSLNSESKTFSINVNSANLALNNDFIVNTTIPNDQYNAQIIPLSNGNVVIAWEYSYSNNSDIQGRIFDANGIAIGNEFNINSHIQGFQIDSSLTPLLSGGFVATWSDMRSNNFDIAGRVFDANGLAISNSDFAISTKNTNNQIDSEVISLTNGGFAITWEDNSRGNSDIRGRVFNSSGSAINNSDFAISTKNTNNQIDPQLTPLTNGGFAITWEDNSSGNSDIRGRVFNANGSALSSDFLVSNTNANNQIDPQLTTLTNGGFAIAWEDNSSGNSDIRGRVFNANGSALSSDFLVSNTNANNQYNPQLTTLTNGSFAIAWEDNSSGNSDIRGRVFNANGSALSSDFLINTTTQNDQYNPQIKTLKNGSFIITWEDNNSNDSTIRGRVFNADGSANSSDFLISNAHVSEQYGAVAIGLKDGNFAIAWDDWLNWNETEGCDVRSRVFDLNGNPVITGSNGADLFDSSIYNSNSQVLAGMAGNDIYVMNENIGNDTIKDSTGYDVLDLTGYDFGLDPFSRLEGGTAGDDLLINLGTNGSINIQNYFNEAGTGMGTGYIEDINFANQHNIDLTDLLLNAWV